MRKMVYISGVLFSSITLLSILFKLVHLQGAQILLIIGIGGFSLIFIPAYAVYRYYKKKKND